MHFSTTILSALLCSTSIGVIVVVYKDAKCKNYLTEIDGNNIDDCIENTEWGSLEFGANSEGYGLYLYSKDDCSKVITGVLPGDACYSKDMGNVKSVKLVKVKLEEVEEGEL